MIVASVMKRNPIFIRPDMSVNDAKALMMKEKVGKLPVLNKANRLVGILTKKDLVNAGPSAATTLDMYEISYLLSKLKVEKVMSTDVTTVQQSEVVEEAARIMADKDIGCLPVMKDDLLVGIITESDLFHVFVDMFAARYEGTRITFLIDEKPGMLAKVAAGVAEFGGNIRSFVTSDGDNMTNRRCTMKVSGVDADNMKKILEMNGATIEDIR